MVWLSKEDIRRDFEGLIDEYEEWFRAACPSRTEFQNTESERLRQKGLRGEPLTAKEIAFREEVGRLIVGEVHCTADRLWELQEQRRQRLVHEVLRRE